MEHKLIIFDIDGTLCDTYDVDTEIFMKVAKDMLGEEINRFEWQLSPHMTDAGILNWLWEKINGCPPKISEIEAFCQEFTAALEKELRQAPHRFKEIPGAKGAINGLPNLGWDVAIGTGGWKRSAAMKLTAVGLPTDLLFASSDDAYDRVEVFRLAARRVGEKRGRDYNRIVLAGDGMWDVQVASEMGWEFLGIGNGNRARLLTEHGATCILANYNDQNMLLNQINNCCVPEFK